MKQETLQLSETDCTPVEKYTKTLPPSHFIRNILSLCTNPQRVTDITYPMHYGGPITKLAFSAPQRPWFQISALPYNSSGFQPPCVICDKTLRNQDESHIDTRSVKPLRVLETITNNLERVRDPDATGLQNSDIIFLQAGSTIICKYAARMFILITE